MTERTAGPATAKKSVWGPALWLYLHTAANYCDDPDAFSALMLSLVGTLPCPDCRKHLKEYTAKLPPSATIRDASSASDYVRELHDHVNVLTGKKRPGAAPLPPRTTRGLHPSSSVAHPPPAFWRTAQPQRLGPRAPRNGAVAAPRLRRH
jgi:hypothetical protein